MLRQFRAHAIRILTCAMALAVAVPVLAQSAPAPETKPRKLPMWKAASPTATVYMLGSIHVGDASMYPMPAAVETAFAESKVLAVEINLKNVDQSKAMKLVQDNGLYTGDDALSHHISKETAAALADFCSKNGFPPAAFDKLRPWVAAVTVIAVAWKQAGEDPALGVDQHFLDESKTPQRIDEFETPELQMAILSGLSDAQQQDMLTQTLMHADKVQESLKKMQNAWKAGDSEALLSFLNDEEDMPPAVKKKLLDDRNVAMADRIDGYLKGKEPCFVVVGAAHLLGDKGVVSLLQSKGYKVEQVTTP
jgi:uncharacterized protein YbaP (TraB family)